MKEKVIGEVTHYYGKLGVVIVKFNQSFSVGDKIRFKGAHTDFVQEVKSIQYDHKDIDKAKKGQEVGIKVGEKVHDSDKVYAVK